MTEENQRAKHGHSYFILSLIQLSMYQVHMKYWQSSYKVLAKFILVYSKIILVMQWAKITVEQLWSRNILCLTVMLVFLQFVTRSKQEYTIFVSLETKKARFNGVKGIIRKIQRIMTIPQKYNQRKGERKRKKGGNNIVVMHYRSMKYCYYWIFLHVCFDARV